MHAVALRALRTAHNPASRQACRLIAGSRYPLSRRAFHQSAISYQSREDPNGTDNARGQNATSGGTSVVDEAAADEPVPSDSTQEVENPSASDAVENVEDTNSTQKVPGRGNGRWRISRLKQPDGLPPVILPDWFWNNVKCLGEEQKSGSLAVYYTTNDAADPSQGSEDAELPAKSAHAVEGIIECGLSSTQDAKYTVHLDVYREILSSIRAGLSLRPSPTVLENKNLLRPVLHLQCPKDGGAFFLDSIVETIATKLEADLIILNPLDLAQLTGPYLDEDLAWTSSYISLLGYETARVAGKLEEFDKETSTPAEDAEETEEDEETMSMSKGPANASTMAFKAASVIEMGKKLSAIFTRMSGSQMKPGDSDKRQGDIVMPFSAIIDPNASRQATRANLDTWRELKKSTMLETLVSGADLKRARDITDGEESRPRDLIIQVQDYKELTRTHAGIEMIDQLRAVVNKRWQGGQNVMIVGTTALEEAESALSVPEIQQLQSDIVEGEKRTIFVPTDRREEQDVAFESDERLRIRTINIRHIQDMVTKLAGDKPITVDIEKDLDTASAYSAGLEDAVWTYPRVQRLATMMLGLEKNPEIINGQIFTKAQHFLSESDNAKYAWGEAELKEEDDEVNNVLDEMNNPTTPQKNTTTKEKLKQIRKNCNNHEKKLLNGVVIPSDIHTTFSDVHVPKETVEALKTLTSLSLLRPEAFTYGVLATDKIPGLLLYGPPGTGKTLLAKAVAKESGATVLEISGAEVNDMYVGEGEKNVRAIFTLAKKLSPCVVFIDEADAIFAARGEARRSSTHRELINQFLREWDGMNDLSAFIMVATNRPFDLDEAVLRRLPRRLLVDLPVEKDREAILRIHLKDEILDESVSLSKLAKDTPFYSGSDLKNLSVAAALACIREENEVAAKHVGDEPYTYPEKRILTKKHFDKAMEEISASISEDMSTLSAIRKFDEKYGDRKGRRKRNAALGFGGTTVPEKDSESARVRKSTAGADV